MRWHDPVGARFGRRGALERKFVSRVRVAHASVAPRRVRLTVTRMGGKVVRVTGLAAHTTSRRAVWRQAWIPKTELRHRRDAQRAAVRRGLSLLRAWGFTKPELHNGAQTTEAAVGRAFARSGWRYARHHHFDATERPDVGWRAMVALPLRAVRRAMRLMDGAALNRQSVAPPGFGHGGRHMPARLANVDPASSPESPAREAVAGGAESSAVPGSMNAGRAAEDRLGLPDMARWLGALFGDETRRPPSGVTGFDGRSAPIFPGRKPGF